MNIAICLQGIIGQGLSLPAAIRQLIVKPKTEPDLAFIKATIFGVLRNYFTLEKTLLSLLNSPLRPKDSDIKMLLISALFQAKYMHVPAHAVSSVNVDAARFMRKKWACGLVNAVTREFLRSGLKLSYLNPNTDSFEHPTWIVDAIKRDWPMQWKQILCENNIHPPMTLRVNVRKTTRSQYIATLMQHDIEALPTRHSEQGLTIVKPKSVSELPGYEKGLFSVQDEAAQLTHKLLDLKKHHRVLDACAAPGGKTTHLLEHVEGNQVTAIDSGEQRLIKLKENLARLKLSCRIINQDATDPSSWWDDNLYDRILLDSPCSATGVIRRHPDIRFHRKLVDLRSVTLIQHALLRNLWPLLKVGGKLLYVTCSVMSIENDRSVETLIKNNNNVDIEDIIIGCGLKKKYGVQILPGESNMDGFYFSLLKKNENAPV